MAGSDVDCTIVNLSREALLTRSNSGLEEANHSWMYKFANHPIGKPIFSFAVNLLAILKAEPVIFLIIIKDSGRCQP